MQSHGVSTLTKAQKSLNIKKNVCPWKKEKKTTNIHQDKRHCDRLGHRYSVLTKLTERAKILKKKAAACDADEAAVDDIVYMRAERALCTVTCCVDFFFYPRR